MFHIGVDLAWGQRQPTGIAVLEETGRLVHVASVRTDDEILATLAPYLDGPCLVAFDAPLVVPNATGNRPAEAALVDGLNVGHAAPYGMAPMKLTRNLNQLPYRLGNRR